ncbi:flagellar hook-associated protein 1 [Thermoclostridium stercorarium subsp. stercorarium DSM 8532]|uniref:Flagellar hook-associated protein 1 n=1 Tax=Thermoclostridium stercorarium (strain ATCC 35414 / DSM 8532 / NCIMB 11754) TaxID=1121335 RepID=L7VMT6_THES1|nr:flagellar hook-associated protein FlgK [Thermoclostridium stercorarium]AGC69535.1 flagellar hook-associated protein 1 [Thermoclostridium stercorarium subsp. stercorarium DSM 8532]AGI40488.1 FlgK [Thermoclostridium stercorarium subsp. stercorarium DSM 8532]
MSTGFSGLTTAVTGMHNNQKALEVTGHNISNLNTKGYTRQQAILATANSRYIVNNWVELGSKVQEIRQIRNSFLDGIYRREANALGYWEARYNGISELESILGEPMTDGLQSILNEFWNAWQELAKSPESLTVRALVRQRAEALVYHLNHIGYQIDKLQEDINNEIIKGIEKVNSITKQIAELNVLIAKAIAANNNPNDYYDQRNLLVDQLSDLIKVEVYEHPDGYMDILVGGYYLVSKTSHTNLVAVQNAPLSHFVVPVIEDLGVEIDPGMGRIKGLMEARGMVSGAKGSYDNGTPNTTCDVTFAVDLSSASSGYLADLQNSIEKYVSELKSNGLEYNLRLVTFNAGTVSNIDFGNNTDDFISAVKSLNISGGGALDFGTVVSNVAGTGPFAEGANRYLVVFSAEALSTTGNLDDYISTLTKNNIQVSVIGTDAGWNSVVKATGGSVYNITADDYSSLMSKVGTDTAADVNKRIATVEESMNIISNVKKMLNAMVNIVLREVNRLHMSGYTLDGKPGGALFETIDPSRPLEMGNIKLSDSLLDLNSIVASSTDANGDNVIAMKIAKLRNESIMASYNQTLSVDSYYQQIILTVGNIGNESRQYVESQQVLVNAAENERQSLMGVSLDEEMGNLIKYKYAYNSATKIVNVINEMLETIIYRTGIVGR